MVVRRKAGRKKAAKRKTTARKRVVRRRRARATVRDVVAAGVLHNYIKTGKIL